MWRSSYQMIQIKHLASVLLLIVYLRQTTFTYLFELDPENNSYVCMVLITSDMLIKHVLFILIQQTLNRSIQTIFFRTDVGEERQNNSNIRKSTLLSINLSPPLLEICFFCLFVFQILTQLPFN